MKTILLALCLLTGCVKSPQYLKDRDAAIAKCKEDCAPRQENWGGWLGCQCVDEKAK